MIQKLLMMLMSALRTYTRMCLCIWILGRAPREKCFGQTSTKRYWQSTTLRQPELARASHLGGLVYKYTLVIQFSADAISVIIKYAQSRYIRACMVQWAFKVRSLISNVHVHCIALLRAALIVVDDPDGQR